MLCDVPDRLGALRRRLFQLILARVGVVGQMTDVRDVDNVGELVALVRQGAAERVGEDIGAHIADVRIVVDRWPARIDTRLARSEERSVGKECVSTCRSRWATYH